jgi:hypothetical protein
MNRTDFIRIIHDTGSLDQQMIGEVRELLNLFPYFQCAHLLLLKGLHNTSDIKFESQLKQSAIYVGDREVLYHLLKREHKAVSGQPENNQPVNYDMSIVTDSQQTVIESGMNSREVIVESEKNNSEPGEPRNTEFSSHGISRSLLITEEYDEDTSENIVFLLDDGEESVEEEIIYMDPSFLIPAQGDLLELDLQEVGSASSVEGQSSESVKEVVDKHSRKQLQTNLIDKFITANPRIEPVRDKSVQQVEDLSKTFVEEKGGFVTETLAKIYINQGYYSKAIDIYEKLSLKFPEKSSYFATQIEKVKGLIK